MSVNSRYLLIPVIFLLVFAIFLISQHTFQGDLMFHTDIARDFLLIEDIIKTKNPTLIGPKAGGISGMFFGPVWLYAHIPLFLLGGGDPVVISYFWVFLVLLSIAGIAFVAYKIFGKVSAIVAALIYAFFAVTFSAGFTQSFGAVLLSPWLLYCMYLYLEKKKAVYLVIALLINGFIYQLQPAVGMITLTATGAVSLVTIAVRREYRHALAYFALLIPFSTYILFELRHDFLQVRSFIEHFTGPGLPKDDRLTTSEYIQNRLDSYFHILDIIRRGLATNVIFLGIYSYIVYLLFKGKDIAGRTYYLLFLSYTLSFILLTLIYRGIIIDYYFLAFLPLSVIAFSGLLHIMQRGVFWVLVSLVLYISISSAIGYRGWWNTVFVGNDASSWVMNKNAAESVYNDAEGDFGYFVYSTDEFGYSARYAMNHMQRSSEKRGALCEKKRVTYLLYYPTAEGAKTDPVYWKKVRVNIQKEPLHTTGVGSITIEKYSLSEEELRIAADPNLVCDLHFR